MERKRLTDGREGGFVRGSNTTRVEANKVEDQAGQSNQASQVSQANLTKPESQDATAGWDGPQ